MLQLRFSRGCRKVFIYLDNLSANSTPVSAPAITARIGKGKARIIATVYGEKEKRGEIRRKKSKWKI
jgi:hypothetical protein